MPAYVVYVDHQHASLFKLLPDHDEKIRLSRHTVRHHTAAEKQKKQNAEPLYNEITKLLSDATDILILGHGIAKKQLLHHFESHGGLAKKVVGVESVDKPTDREILHYARRFFRHHNLFRSLNA